MFFLARVVQDMTLVIVFIFLNKIMSLEGFHHFLKFFTYLPSHVVACQGEYILE